eukprot:scaffold2119_cov355-Prasinococcus_capsulatus_cf.AAC.8
MFTKNRYLPAPVPLVPLPTPPPPLLTPPGAAPPSLAGRPPSRSSLIRCAGVSRTKMRAWFLFTTYARTPSSAGEIGAAHTAVLCSHALRPSYLDVGDETGGQQVVAQRLKADLLGGGPAQRAARGDEVVDGRQEEQVRCAPPWATPRQ